MQAVSRGVPDLAHEYEGNEFSAVTLTIGSVVNVAGTGSSVQSPALPIES
ncbi:MAG: hypothetical protein OEX00_04935 [Gammaproteobacteria bacterium]|nr:hypothetical protein [Gammaproteobacteria bacterium]